MQFLDLVKWFNENNGFSAAILSIVGLFLSTIAIVISIRTAKLPYKKRIELVSTYNYAMPGSILMGIEVQAINIGNRPVRIKKLGLGIKRKGSMEHIINLYNKNESQLLNPTEEMRYGYGIDAYKHILNENKNKSILYLLAVDNEEKNYTKKLGRISKIKKRF